MEEIKLDFNLFVKLAVSHLNQIEKEIDDWDPRPMKNDEDALDDLYEFRRELNEILAVIPESSKAKGLHEKVEILIEMNAPEETIPDSWDRA